MTVFRLQRPSRRGNLLVVGLIAVCMAMFASGAFASGSASQEPTATASAVASLSLRSASDTLALETEALKRCRLEHPKHCSSQLHALRLARRHLLSARARLARFSTPAQRGVNNLAAPTITVSGQTLTWNEIGGASSYVFVRKVPGQADAYSVVTSTSVTPSAVPGTTVHYSVRANVTGSGWAHEVSISYPAASTATTSTESPPPASTEGSSEAIGGGSISGGNSETFGQPFVKGINTNLQGWGMSNLPQIVSEMSTLGINWEREDLSWANAEPQRGVYNWLTFEQTASAAKADGITILPVVGYAPSWTTPGNSAAYAEFVAAAVARFGPGTADNLPWWELWNEPYFSYAWSGKTPEPEAYARDALAAAEAAKHIAPSIKLLLAADYQDSPQTGGSTPWETSWINDMFTAAPTLGEWISGISVHPYGDDPTLPLAQVGGWKDANGEWAFQRIDTIREKFLAHSVNVPFWITEEGWLTAQVSEAAQAQYYADLVTQIAARPWIRALFPYCLREFEQNPNKESQFGLLKFGTWEPKAAFSTLQQGLKTLS